MGGTRDRTFVAPRDSPIPPGRSQRRPRRRSDDDLTLHDWRLRSAMDLASGRLRLACWRGTGLFE